jgi:hypothetical protein
MNLENLIFVLAVLGMGLFNVVLPWLRKRLEDERSGEPAPIELETMQAEPAAEPKKPRETPRRVRVPQTTGTPAVPARRPRRSPVGSLGDARRGIVLRTILGPCRALEPFEAS